MRRPFALIELAPGFGSAARAHRADGATVELVNPLREGWPEQLVDRVDAHFDRIVILSVPANLWVGFARMEAALLSSIGNGRPVAFVFVDPTGAGTRLQTHLKWLAKRELPSFAHRLVLLGAPLYPPVEPVVPGYYDYFTLPFFMRQVARAVLGEEQPPGQPREYATFHTAWSKATIGTKAMMFEPVGHAMRAIADMLGSANLQLEREPR